MVGTIDQPHINCSVLMKQNLNEVMERDIMGIFKLLPNVEEVNFTARDHDPDECSVICAKALSSGQEQPLAHRLKARYTHAVFGVI